MFQDRTKKPPVSTSSHTTRDDATASPNTYAATPGEEPAPGSRPAAPQPSVFPGSASAWAAATMSGSTLKMRDTGSALRGATPGKPLAFVDLAASQDTHLTPSRFDAPLQVKRPSEIQPVTDFKRFERMARSWFLRRGFFMTVGAAFTYNAVLCPVMTLEPFEDKCLAGLRRRRYLSQWFNLGNNFERWTGIRRYVWLFQYRAPLSDDERDGGELLHRSESDRAHRTRAASETLRFNSALPPVGFGAPPLRPEELPSNVKWRAESLLFGAGKGTAAAPTASTLSTAGSVVASALVPTKRPLRDVAQDMLLSVLRWVPRTLTFNRPWGDTTGNSVQYNAILFEPTSFSEVKIVTLPVRPVDLEAPDGARVRVRMLAQLHYRREESVKKSEAGIMKYGQTDARLDYVAPQVCDAWLQSFRNLGELIEMAPMFRRTATRSVLKHLPLADFLAAEGEDPPSLVEPLTLETAKSLERSIALGAKMLPQEELVRRHLAMSILQRMDSRIAIDDVFWYFVVNDIKDLPADEHPGVYERPNISTGNYVL
jgi:hypothetical protein